MPAEDADVDKDKDEGKEDEYGVKEDHAFSNQQLKNINSQLLDESGNKRTFDQYSSKLKQEMSKTDSHDQLLSNPRGQENKS